jgi:cobalt-precorrin 5A hydrolase
MMEKKSIMGNDSIKEPKINTMGSEVVEGFECKPKVLDPNKPIMHYKNIVYVCVDKRCAGEGSAKKADELRELVKDMGLDVGEDRVKISKSYCYGACRYKQVANIFSNTNVNGIQEHNNVWLKQTQKYDLTKWRELFLALKKNRVLDTFEQIDMKVY